MLGQSGSVGADSVSSVGMDGDVVTVGEAVVGSDDRGRLGEQCVEFVFELVLGASGLDAVPHS